MLFKTIVGALAAATLAAACTFLPQPSHNVIAESPDYNPAVSARIRILSGNGTGNAVFRPGQACHTSSYEQDDAAVKVGDGFWSTWKYSSRSVTIGMPVSPRRSMTVEGLDFKDFIREYVVPANKPLTVTLSMGNSGGNFHWSCSPPATYFTPQAGQDYDIFLDGSAGRCWVGVRRIDGNGLDEPVPGKVAPKCAS